MGTIISKQDEESEEIKPRIAAANRAYFFFYSIFKNKVAIPKTNCKCKC